MNFVWSLDDTTFFGDRTQRWMAGFILNFTGLWTIFLRWYVYFQILKKNQIWHFDGYFSYDCCLDFRWFEFQYTVLLRWLGWFIWNFTVLWAIFQRCYISFWIRCLFYVNGLLLHTQRCQRYSVSFSLGNVYPWYLSILIMNFKSFDYSNYERSWMTQKPQATTSL